jgi:ABC-type phosphate transport system substrate-binding protein
MKTFLSARRVAVTAAASAAAIGAFALPSAASATDLGTQCSGSNIEGLGSSFQAPVEKIWTGEAGLTEEGFNASIHSKLACSGTQGSKGKPTVKYNQEETPTNNKGSGACLKDFGNGVTPRMNQFPVCGTDEAPSATVKEVMEGHEETGAEKGKGESVLSIPVVQGAVAVIVHLPSGCTAASEPKVGKELKKFSRLSLSAEVVEGIFRGSITNWKKAVEASGGSNVLTCTGGTVEEETPIKVVVRADKSGTTHIFKSWLGQINETGTWQAEAFNEIEVPTGSGKFEKPCSSALPEEAKTWVQVQEGCENQRWPTAAHVIRPTETGNPGVIKEVNADASSIGYADLAVAREKHFFSEPTVGGEGTDKFWALVSNSKNKTALAKQTFQDPSSNGDSSNTPGNSNCKSTKFVNKVGEKFPPEKARQDWSKVKGAYDSATYGVCGITYALAARQYWYFEKPLLTGATEAIKEEESKKLAQSVHDYLLFVLSKATGGGGKEAENEDYYPLPGTVSKIAETGVKEIGSKEA